MNEKMNSNSMRNMYKNNTSFLIQERDRLQGPRSKFSSGGAKEECEKENFGGGAGGGACLWISIQFL